MMMSLLIVIVQQRALPLVKLSTGELKTISLRSCRKFVSHTIKKRVFNCHMVVVNIQV